MLPARHRLRRSEDFGAAVRGPGRARVGGPLLVVHASTPSARDAGPVRVGFVVANTVGTAVVRNRVKRRLRAQMATRVSDIPAGTDVVVRALPTAAGSSSAELGVELDRQLARLVRPGRPVWR